ncbi:MAG: preprotein translocase subunit YajC [Thermoleophilia bacterium]|nr:preprotein translocase subunit YajC [Thermoleophilia bacterium]
MDFLIILLFGFAIMWLLIVMPQRRRQRAHQELVGNLRPGDYVLTVGGMYGTVNEIGEDDIGLEVSPDVEVRVAKRSVASVVPPDQIEEIEIGEDPIVGDRG